MTRPDARRLQGSEYVDDDGSAEMTLLASLHAHAGGAETYPEVLAVLVGSRLLVPVVAVLGEAETVYDERTGRSLTTDKTSDMATVLLTGADGRRALLGFTGTESLRAWDPDARPVPVAMPLAAATAVQEGADALVVDVGSQHTFVVAGEDLHRIAAGWQPVRLPGGEWAWLGADPDQPDEDSAGDGIIR